jgi:CheY-like chemotaxis protein
MTIATILLVDNKKEFLDTWRRHLEKAGYEVITATTVADAQRRLRSDRLDAAVLDLRLEDDDDKTDTSGFRLAEAAPRGLVKIILTEYPSTEKACEALGIQPDGLPLATAFVSKQQGPDKLLEVIDWQLSWVPGWLKTMQSAIEGTDTELKEDYDTAQRRSEVSYWISLGIALLGVMMIFAGVYYAYSGRFDFGAAGSAAGIVTQVVNYLLFRLVDASNRRMERYHAERTEHHRFKILLTACDGLERERTPQDHRAYVIKLAARRWLGAAVTDVTPLDDQQVPTPEVNTQ